MSKIKQLQELLKENPKDAFLRYALALEHVKQKELSLAKNIFEELIQEEPDYLATYFQFGNLLAETGDYALAEQTFKKGIEVATQQNKLKTRQELEQAMFLLD